MGFHYREGELHAGGAPLTAIAETVGTPTYVYDAEIMEERYRAYAAALDPLGVAICYAVKANPNQAVLRVFAGLGAGMDVVSGGELARALAAGAAADRIVFSGVGKTRQEIAAALDSDIHQINAESIEELTVIDAVAGARGRIAPVALRVNPDIDAGTHNKITTGRREDKFGIDFERALEAYALADSLPNLRPVGLAVHIGSQILDLSPYRAAYRRLAELVRALRVAGHRVQRLDLGGGLGIAYRRDQTPPDLHAYAAIISETVGDLDCALMIEPGRGLIGPAGLLLARVTLVKSGAERRFVILDAAMNDLLRPSLYDAWHEIVPVIEPSDAEATPVDVVGPVCESGDTFATQRKLPSLEEGDLVAVLDAGAYGATMASTYNSRPLPAEVLARDGRWAVVRKRPSLTEMIEQERMGPWQSASLGHSRAGSSVT